MSTFAPAAARSALTPAIEQAAAKSAVAQVPKVGRMARETSLSISGELAAWEKDHNSAHLLRVISMQQAIIAAHAHSGHGHSVENTGAEDLVFVAAIVLE